MVDYPPHEQLSYENAFPCYRAKNLKQKNTLPLTSYLQSRKSKYNKEIEEDMDKLTAHLQKYMYDFGINTTEYHLKKYDLEVIKL
jgi:hypothetical protein